MATTFTSSINPQPSNKVNKVSSLFFALALFAFSCQTKLPENTNTAQRQKPTNTNFSVADSLAKYQSADSLLLVNDSTHTILCIGKAGAAKYAVWLVDSTLIFYQQQLNQKWLACDTLSYPLDFSFAKSMDLNADGVDDVRISTISGSAGNTENIVFLFDSKRAKFRHNEYYDLPNVELDKQNKFIKSWWFAGVVHCQDKQKYRITGDSLTLEAGVTYCPDEKTHGDTGTLEFYREVRNKRIITQRTSGKVDKLWQSFNKAFWDTSDE